MKWYYSTRSLGNVKIFTIQNILQIFIKILSSMQFKLALGLNLSRPQKWEYDCWNGFTVKAQWFYHSDFLNNFFYEERYFYSVKSMMKYLYLIFWMNIQGGRFALQLLNSRKMRYLWSNILLLNRISSMICCDRLKPYKYSILY